MLGLEFPPINEVIRWQEVFPTFNKIGLIAVAAAVIASLVFILASRYDSTRAPKGVRNLAEIIIDFIEDNIVLELGKLQKLAPGLKCEKVGSAGCE